MTEKEGQIGQRRQLCSLQAVTSFYILRIFYT